MESKRLACKNMIERQLCPSCHLPPSMLSVIETIPRHLFVPDEFVNVAYSDTRIPLPNQCSLLPPLSYARLLECIKPNFSHSVLDIGSGYGYFSALLSRLFRKVTALESSPAALSHAQEIHTKLSLRNIDLFSVDEYRQAADTELFDCIVIEGSLTSSPEHLLPSLKEGGEVIFPLAISSEQCRITIGKKFGDTMVCHDVSEHYFPPLSPTLKRLCCHHC